MTVNIRTGISYYLRGLVVWPALHIFKCRYRISVVFLKETYFGKDQKIHDKTSDYPRLYILIFSWHSQAWNSQKTFSNEPGNFGKSAAGSQRPLLAVGFLLAKPHFGHTSWHLAGSKLLGSFNFLKSIQLVVQQSSVCWDVNSTNMLIQCKWV